MTFFEKGQREHYSIRVSELSNNLLMFAASTAALYFIVFRIIPEDIFTSSLWLENAGFQLVVTSSPDIIQFSSWSQFQDVTWSAFSFGMIIFLFQILTMYKAQAVGAWGSQYPNTMSLVSGWLKTTFSGKRFSIQNFNHEKMMWYSAVSIFVIVDLVTDTEFRSSFASLVDPLWWKAFFFSFLYFTVCSEVGLVLASQWSLNYGLNLIYIIVGLMSPALQAKIRRITGSNISIAAPTAPPRNNQPNQPGPHQPSNNQGKNRPSNNQGKNKKDRVPHSGPSLGVRRDDIPENIRAMLENRD